ncbi:PEP-CTERM sorting domain-containing protein [Geitlerinema splendidum]|nr:PEP-CTERM sorting domain-containing protein [Geitlerinema splendidum]
MNEDFESFNNYQNGGIFASGPLFGGFANFASSTNSNIMWIIEPGGGAGWGLGGTNGAASAHGGAKAAGLFNNNNNQLLDLTFSNPVVDFGGWFVTVNLDQPDVPLTFAFFDSNNTFIGNDSVHTVDGNYVWKGWTHAAGISRIEMRGNLAPVMDDLQLNPVPEPATMIAAGIGLLAFARRRKSK